MSGIAGILHEDGSPIDRSLLERMTRFMAFRGPDAQEFRVSGAVGFGCALLRPGGDDAGCQPSSAPADIWVLADCRLDGRSDLRAKLAEAGAPQPDVLSDAQLIAQAYRQWGTECVRHLLGDFAFAIWDAPRRQLFCARDHLGVKPFYYARRGAAFLFSNTLDCIRRHPRVSDSLNDAAIAEFLLFDRNLDEAATTFADISRLPPAHSLTLADGRLTVERYWSLPVDGRIRYQDARDYTDHFARLLDLAVGDRLRGGTAAMLMSGGVDSTAVATTARRVQRGGEPPVRGFTCVYDRLLLDQERHYAGLAARAIDMPIEFWPFDGYSLFDGAGDTRSARPEPYHWPLDAATLDFYRHMAGSTRVVLTGEGGDPLSYFGSLLATPRFHRLLPATAAYLLSRRRLPPIGLRTRGRRLLGIEAKMTYPDWFNPGFAARMELTQRFENQTAETADAHPTHALAFERLSSSYWPWMFEGLDPGATRTPLEFRHPLFDIRVIEYVLAVPLMPWSVDKELLRSVTAGVQPDEVRRRPKAPLGGDPIVAHLRNGRPPELGAPAMRLGEYVDVRKLEPVSDAADPEQVWVDLRPVSLNLWLRRCESGLGNQEQI